MELMEIAVFAKEPKRTKFMHSEIVLELQPYGVHNIREAFKKANLVGHRLEKMEIRIKWSPPPQGWIKLNSDGSSMGVSRRAGYGGVL
ncbi:hypothetical protein PIB30_061687 [Stylosanthes scabra]|uniref:Uncharacterized protein n=1 Tax=Stylosanthes scabra TaxID=79078 RepID=A0ABU6YL72_9FABA|nr:hypothetical protein [Stylosanthes scabra]